MYVYIVCLLCLCVLLSNLHCLDKLSGFFGVLGKKIRSRYLLYEHGRNENLTVTQIIAEDFLG